MKCTNMCCELINLFQVEGDVQGENCEWFILEFMKEERVHGKFTKAGHLADGDTA